ncbi:MAG: XRE family transcriptional regulator [Candidatus Omnitrophota bacterium]
MLKEIGAHIRQIRKIRKISLTELSSASHVQIATLSRIENGKMIGTLESHLNIAKALGVNLIELYEGIENPILSEIKQENPAETLAPANDKISCEILSRQATSNKMLPLLIKMNPHSVTPPEQGKPGAERFIYVLEGSVTIKIKDQSVKLDKNASLYFNASGTHTFENPGATPAKLLSVMTPVSL